MNNTTTVEKWQKLYNLAQQIRDLNPWEYLEENHILTIIYPDEFEPIFCSILGSNEECYGITVYDGFNNFNNYFKAKLSDKIPPSQRARYLQAITCQFCNRDDMKKEELALVKALDIKFRGKNQWIAFRVSDPNVNKVIFCDKQLDELIDIYKHILVMIKEYKAKMLFVDFEQGQTLIRTINQQTGSWVCGRTTLLMPPINYSSFNPTEQSMKTILSQRQNNNEIEIDMVHTNTVIKHTDDNEYFVKIIAIADHVSKKMAIQCAIVPDEDYITSILGMFFEYIIKYGRPKTIFIRDEFSRSLFENICKQAKIKLKISPSLRAIDDFIKI